MTSRERVLAALDHQVPDRVPLDAWLRPEVVRAVARKVAIKEDEVEAYLGVDVTGPGMGESYPEFQAKTTGVLTGDCPYAGSRFIFHEDGSFEDVWGVRRRKGTDGKYVEWVSGPLSGDVQALRDYQFPKPVLTKTDEDLALQVKKMQQTHAVMAGVPNPFKTAWELRGLENLLMDYLVEQDFLNELYDRLYARETQRGIRAARAGIDIFTIVGDIAMQNRLMMSPAAWRQFDKPRLAKLIAAVKAVNPSMHVYFHCDGDVSSIVDDWIEIGLTVLNPIQPECMDPAQFKQRYGDKLTLWGTGSLQHTLPFGTEADVRAEVRHRIEVCGKGGGLVLMPSNVVGFDVPLNNLLAFYDEAKTYRAKGSTR